MASPGRGNRIDFIFQSDSNVISLCLIKSPEGGGAGLEMGYYNGWLVLFSIMGMAVQASLTAMGYAEM